MHKFHKQAEVLLKETIAYLFQGAEIRLTHEDVRRLLEKGFNSGFYSGEYKITSFTMHPGNKYCVRMKVQPPVPKQKALESNDQQE